ncbi:hypothetical protein TRVA0_001S05490 [Trichomonascus vanleenenianus]|uniref:translin family protein n=1 Tax=Trichomonascus vanleenenianus TaxID=2268995 RepID=UPI003ECA341E
MSSYETLFEEFRVYLDGHHDQRERVIKASRDITASSKKIIFALHRLGPDELTEEIIASNKTVEKHFKDIHARMESVKEDITGVYQWKYTKQFSGCLQEYIEALSFQHFLIHRNIITYEQVCKSIGEGVLVTLADYLLGLMDLTGELMRYAIGHLAKHERDRKPSQIATQILQAMREFKQNLDAIDSFAADKVLGMKELDKKISVFESSLAKVEQGIYSLVVRALDE